MSKKLQEKDFLEALAALPRVALNLLVTNQDRAVLLAKRAIPPQEGVWHMPGSYVLKGEPFAACLERVAVTELGLAIDGTKPQLAGVFEDLHGDPRGHCIDIVYTYKITNELNISPTKETKKLQFFTKLPENIGFNHRETLEKLGYT